MPYTRREAIEMKKNSKCVYVCIGKKNIRRQKLNFLFVFRHQSNKKNFIFFLFFLLFTNTHFSYLSNSNIAVGLNIKTNKLDH
jgi:hypothetical protein